MFLHIQITKKIAFYFLSGTKLVNNFCIEKKYLIIDNKFFIFLCFYIYNSLFLHHCFTILIYTTMAYVISEDCIACGTCIGECPVEAISEGDIYKIDPDTCAECGTCASVCPTGAIHEA